MRMNSFSFSRRLQLWSDASQENFAVRLSNELSFRAASNPDASYTVLVDEAEFFDDMEYDWNYLLTHWTGVKNGEIKLVDAVDEKRQPVEIDLFDDVNGKRVQGEKPKPILKCNYCMLSYGSGKERREHEAIWHAEKVRTRAVS